MVETLTKKRDSNPHRRRFLVDSFPYTSMIGITVYSKFTRNFDALLTAPTHDDGEVILGEKPRTKTSRQQEEERDNS